MLRLLLGIVIGLALLLATGCDKDEPDDLVNPSIQFRGDSTFTYANDTVGLQDTVLFGVIVTEGSESLRSFKVVRSYDGPYGGITLDSVPYTGSPFTYIHSFVMRDQAGTERYNFSVLDEHGNTINRALTLTVQ
jgi:hypothetical protein